MYSSWVKYRCSRKKAITRTFGAKASFEEWSTAFYVIFREESENKAENVPKQLKRPRRFFEVRRTLSDVVFRGESEFEVKMSKNPSKKLKISNFEIFKIFKMIIVSQISNVGGVIAFS